ncbi:receptor-type tyrosine-protein phosphatase F-like [Colletes gigas]|uniref:receptor-type tyrosine-protein phosphatase F-like n=1 Tax=Colletes gigas TaxID=935657 RepID=UPI001C9BA70E|nr:receptor-type tyrosine-protein phosphatase F-like [Colletes gigas]
MSVLEILFLVIKISIISGRLTVLKSVSSRHLPYKMCMTEDDGGGLVWNINLTSRDYDALKKLNFRVLNYYQTKEIDCDLDSNESCTNTWNTAGWSLTDSKENPMGPVFDRRWEGFIEYNNFDEPGYFSPDKLTKLRTFVVSIRGTNDALILLCESEHYTTDFCYWIILGGWRNTISVIRRCATGVPILGQYSYTYECGQERNSYAGSVLSPTEWRTFIVTWNESAKNLSVYNTEKLLLTYVETEELSSATTVNCTLFIGSHTEMLFRFHLYNFLHTIESKAALTSPTLSLLDGNLCVEIIIGLCAECEMEIALINNRYEKQVLETIKGSTVAAAHGLPMWQYVRINRTISSDFVNVKIQLIPGLERESCSPFWAVANFRACPPTGSIRYVTTKNYERYLWPPVTCQKLFYKEKFVVNSDLDVSTSVKIDGFDCPDGKVGPYCSINCDFQTDNFGNCTNTVICESMGCTCLPGFTGIQCENTCPLHRYGQNCEENCGECDNNVCDFKTGNCMYGCNNSQRYYVPPLCKKSIDVLPPPKIDFINETTVRAIVPAIEEYKLTSFRYQFVILKIMENVARIIGDPVIIFENTTALIGYTNDLEPGTTYNIYCLLYYNEQLFILGEVTNFTTKCTPTNDFRVIPGNNSLTLVKDQNIGYSYCPDNWYSVVIEHSETGVQIIKENALKLPYHVLDLKAYTYYKITVAHQTVTFFSEEVRTLDGEPSKVTNVETELISNSNLTLKWNPPRQLNGIIKYYKIILKIETYKGCDNLRKDSPKWNVSNEITSTSITFANLVPYAKYVVEISACTSYCGPSEKRTIDTVENEMPTSVYSNLRIEDFTLKWDQPENCTTISGSMFTRIIIIGISKSVANVNITKQTTLCSMDLKKFLCGAETYKIRIYVIRGYGKKHNDLLYQEIRFTTPPKAPPSVRNLEIFEIDTLYNTIHLRWQKPEPPIHGEIEFYTVKCCNNRMCKVLMNISPTAYCNLWNEYICATADNCKPMNTIMVSANNVNVSTPGTSMPINLNVFEPEAPKIFNVEALEKGVVNASWSHPWKTGERLAEFLITVEMISSDLRMEIRDSIRATIYEYQVKEYQVRYNEQLHLLSSTIYDVSVCALTISGKRGASVSKQVRTPLAMAFEGELTSKTSDIHSTIELRIPVVSNVTKNSLINVAVKGSQSCDHYMKLSPFLREKAGIGYDEIAWNAARIPTHNFAGRTFTIGDNKVYGGMKNCPLKPDESYEIVVILQTEGGSMNNQAMVVKTTSIRIGEVPKRHDEAWLVPLTILLLIAIVVAVYFYRRKKPGLLKTIIVREEMALARNAGNLEDKSILTNSKQVLSVAPIASDKECVSRTSTPDSDDTTLVNYVNPKEEATSLVKVKDFEDYVRQAIDSGLLDRQYNILPRGQTKPWTYGKLPQNKSKNRYGNLIAYDENRVILNILPDDPYSDYINANYIKGYKKEKCYIATQGPKPNTIIDFWRMIWQEGTLIICMVANLIENGKAKCEQYWPDIRKKKKYGDLLVFHVKQTVFADYTFRTFHVTCEDETRKIEHLHYTAWPDHGVPLSTHSVVRYLKKLLATSPGNGPVVVHCSAGVGRTGTIILCDVCLRRAAAEGVVDMFAETESIRSQRANMVDTKQQYLLAHLTLVECLLSIPTSLPCNEIFPTKIKELKKQLAMQQLSLEKTIWQDEALRPINSAPLTERNLAKNRFPELATVNRVYLKRYPPADEDSDYISAVYVDGMRLQKQYIATQLPLPGTVNDFWRMVAEYNVELIVMLQPPDPNDTTCCSIVPYEEFKPVPYINIKTKEFIEFEFYTSQKLILVDNSEKPPTEQQVTILCSTEWKAGRNQDPPATMMLMSLWQASEKIPRGDGPTVVVCHDGVTGCGLYLALSFLLEKMAVERECDVCLAIRAVRRSRPDFVRSLEQMEYLYDATITYFKYFETYANFM